MEYLKFGWPDYLVLAMVLSISAAIGFFYACTGGKQNSTKEYLHANNSMHWIPVALSFTSSCISSLTIMGLPGEVYSYGTMFIYFILPNPLAVACGMTLYIPVYERLGITSINEYVGQRFGRGIRILCLILGLFDLLAYTAMVIYGPALAFSAVTELDLWASVFLISFIGILYTMLGGIKAVLWTDTVQCVIMLAGSVAVVISGTIKQGGFLNVWKANKISGRLDFLDTSHTFDIDPRARHTFWSLTVYGFLTMVHNSGITQASLQRRLALPSRKDTYIAFMLASVGISAFQMLGLLTGMVIYANYSACDPLDDKKIFSNDQLYPLYVMKLFGEYPGLVGLILSAVFSASLSTISTNLCNFGTMVLQDIVRPLHKNISDWKSTVILKITCGCTGLLAIIIVVIAKYLGAGILGMAMAIYGMSLGPYLAIFTLGMFVPVVNQKGLLTGIILSAAFIYWIGFGGLIKSPYVHKFPTTTQGCNVTDEFKYNNVTPPIFDASSWQPHKHYRSGVESLYDISYAWYSFGGCLLASVLSVVLSLIIGHKNEPKISYKLLSPYIYKSSYLPKSWRERINYGADESSDKLSDPLGEKAQTGDKDAVSLL